MRVDELSYCLKDDQIGLYMLVYKWWFIHAGTNHKCTVYLTQSLLMNQ